LADEYRAVPLFDTATGADWSSRPSGRGAVVAVEQATESFTNDDFSVASRRCATDQFVVEPLMRSLAVVVVDVRRQRAPKVGLPEEDDVAQTLVLHRLHPALGKGVGVRRQLLLMESLRAKSCG